MIDSSKLKVGDTFYGVHETNCSFNRKKIHMEIDGVDWFRYDKPRRTYELVVYKVLGILTKSLEGKWRTGEEYELKTEFYLESTTSACVKDYTTVLYSDEEETYFSNKESVLEYIKTLEADARISDMDWGLN